MRDVTEVTQLVLAGVEVADILSDLSERARTLVSASVAWVVVPDDAFPAGCASGPRPAGARTTWSAPRSTPTPVSRPARCGTAKPSCSPT